MAEIPISSAPLHTTVSLHVILQTPQNIHVQILIHCLSLCDEFLMQISEDNILTIQQPSARIFKIIELQKTLTFLSSVHCFHSKRKFFHVVGVQCSFICDGVEVLTFCDVTACSPGQVCHCFRRTQCLHLPLFLSSSECLASYFSLACSCSAFTLCPQAGDIIFL